MRVCLHGAGLGDNCCLDRTYGGWDVFAITAYLTNIAAFVMAIVAGCVCAHILLDRRQVDNFLAIRWVFLRPMGVLRPVNVCAAGISVLAFACLTSSLMDVCAAGRFCLTDVHR